jgi:hypothetical protein
MFFDNADSVTRVVTMNVGQGAAMTFPAGYYPWSWKPRQTTHKTSGKLYFEVTVPAGDFEILFGNPAYPYQFAALNSVTEGIGGSGIVKVAYDHTAKKIWVGKGAAWQYGGDPGAGTGETLNSASYTDTEGLWVRFQSLVHGQDFLVQTDGAFAYTPPTGFVGWDS